ncbi:MAG: phosphoribosyl-ATP diphosphatase [Legionella sp.]|nr:MAG: phosphoribosyl-ATP diphosphatase [Legionella sp.]PJD99319.1 MAG: phosphoribosyl-ATP diphosphatase [Legionella sp.]
MNEIPFTDIDWHTIEGIVPAIIQHARNGDILLFGYMNQESLIASLTSGQLILYNKTEHKLWRIDKPSDQGMSIHQISVNTDKSCLLIQVTLKDTDCLSHYTSAFNPHLTSHLSLFDELIQKIEERAAYPDPKSYTTKILDSGVQACAKKVGEEAIEVIIAATSLDGGEIIKQCADLIYHILLLLNAAQLNFYDVLHCINEPMNN